jgi:hypothetical protein
LPDGTREIFFAPGLDDPNQLEAAWEFAFLAQRNLVDFSLPGGVKAGIVVTPDVQNLNPWPTRLV